MKAKWANQFGRIYSLNESAFDAVTEQSAYWVGFLMADGNVYHMPRGKGVMIALKLAEKDKGHLEKFRDFLGSTHPIRFQRARQNAFRGRVINSGPSCYLAIQSRRLAEALGRFGVVPRKTYTASVIGLADNRHFWRGMMDGDGSFGTDVGGYTYLNLIGADGVLQQFSAFVRTVVPTWKGSVVRGGERYKMVHLRGRHAEMVVAHVYGDCLAALDRKRVTAERITISPLRFVRGEENRSSKLRMDQILEIRRRYPMEGYRRLARRFGVNPSTIGRVIHRKTWGHVGPE